MSVNPYNRYKEQSLLTLTGGELVVKLYEGVIKQLYIGAENIDNRDYVKANVALQKAHKIITHLQTTLDMKYEISAELNSFYVFFCEQIMKANVTKNSNLINEIIPLVDDLRSAFAQSEKLARIK